LQQFVSSSLTSQTKVLLANINTAEVPTVGIASSD